MRRPPSEQPDWRAHPDPNLRRAFNFGETAALLGQELNRPPFRVGTEQVTAWAAGIRQGIRERLQLVTADGRRAARASESVEEDCV